MTIMRLAQSRPELFGSRAGSRCSAPRLGVDGPLTDSRHPRPHLSSSRRAIDGGLNRIPEPSPQGRRAEAILDVVTRRMAFGSEDVPPSYVDFASEMLAEIPLEVVDYYQPLANSTSMPPSRSSARYRLS